MLCKFQSYVMLRNLLLRRFYATSNLPAIRELPAKAYQPKEVEKSVTYEFWEKNGLFEPLASSKAKNFSMVLPPPNVTGKLHLGHALGCTIQDVIVRRNRALGSNTIWVPGTDHAGIATQGVVEKYLKNTKGLDRHKIGREEFNKEVWLWKEKHGNTIQKQLKQLGCSLDWSREVFTLDPKHTEAVNKAFIQLFNKGLIYRRNALINWCNALKSTVSDIEVANVPIKAESALKVAGYDKPVIFGQLFCFAYKIFSTNDEVVVCTTQPETMIGDVAVAVNPNDERYKHLRGKHLHHPYQQYTIPIIFDEFVDMKFGTGAVKITPAHSKIDYEIALKHKLPMLQVINEEGQMINAGPLNNLHRYDAREKVLEKLAELGFLREIKPHDVTLPICSRTGDLIDYLPKEQWFVDCKQMNENARQAVLEKKLKIIPEKYVSQWLHWTGENSKDWCISRQLWWGHQIPAYKCSSGSRNVWVAAENEEQAKKLAAPSLSAYPEDTKVERDPDVLDTWFSSGIYPFAAMGWPGDTTSEHYNTFYPLSLMVTGHDILGFWVHRMVMLGLELTGTLPFDQVMLHGIICDSKGAKMSKSKGNVIDPTDVINGISLENLKNKSKEMHKQGILTKAELDSALKYQTSMFGKQGIPECGVDALRFTLLSQDVKSHFVNFDVDMCHANKLFCNKIWQSLRFTQYNCSQLPSYKKTITKEDLTMFDRWILSRLADMVAKVNEHIEKFDFHLATQSLRKHIYNEFCDVYLEATKPCFRDSENNINHNYAHAQTLCAVLNTSLRCLNPFMIYLTEELIPKVPKFDQSIIHSFADINEKYFLFPQAEDFECWRDIDIEKRIGKILEITGLVREMKTLCGMPNSAKPSVFVKTPDEVLKVDLVENLPIVKDLARCSGVDIVEADGQKTYIRGVLDKDSDILVEVTGIDADSALTNIKVKLTKKIDKLKQTISNTERRFATTQYINATPEDTKLVDAEKLTEKREELKKLESDLSTLSKTIYNKDKD